MRILVCCDQGNNRSVQFAHLLRYQYKNSDVLPVGLTTFSQGTLDMLYQWAQIILLVDTALLDKIPVTYQDRVTVWNVGPDTYKRPFNETLFKLATKFIKENPLSC